MEYRIKLIILLSFFALISCKNEVEKPKVAYSKTSKEIVKQIDTTKIEIADLPIQFVGTKYLIFPIGSSNPSEKESGSFTISNNMDNEITGYLKNLNFQNIDSDVFTTLTDKPIFLESVSYLKTIADKSKQQILVYQLADNDSNEDGRLDSNDIKSLYLSDISGLKFTKISADFQEITNWKIIESQNRLYFKTIEDTNKNGKFETNDKLHYGFVNLIEKDWHSIEYNPFKVEEKLKN